MSESPTDAPDIAAEHRAWGARTNGRVWELLELDERTADDNRELVDAAHASRWHWRHGGEVINEQRAEWLLSRVYAVLGDGPAALGHAAACWELTEAADLAGFDLAYACEAMYRAYAVLGERDDAEVWHERALDVGADIPDAEDRELFEADLAIETP